MSTPNRRLALEYPNQSLENHTLVQGLIAAPPRSPSSPFRSLTYHQHKFLVYVALGNRGLEVWALQEPEEKLIHQLGIDRCSMKPPPPASTTPQRCSRPPCPSPPAQRQRSSKPCQPSKDGGWEMAPIPAKGPKRARQASPVFNAVAPGSVSPGDVAKTAPG